MSEQVKAPSAPVEGITAANTAPVEQPKIATPPEQDPVTRERFALLARKEKALRGQMRQFEEKQRQFEESQRQVQPQVDWKQRAAQDPIGLLAEAGISQDQISQMLLTDPRSLEMAQLKQEIASLRKSQEETFNQAKTIQERNRENAIKTLGREVSLLVDGNDAYEAVRLEGDAGKEAVTELIVQTYDAEGINLSVQEAARQVEEYFVEKAKSYSSLKKLKPAEPVKVENQAPDSKEQQTTQQQRNKPSTNSVLPYRESFREGSPNTITQRMTVQTRPYGKSDEERVQRAILAGKGMLNKQ